MDLNRNQAPIRLSFLPLQNLSEDSRIQMFCTGLRMDILTDLARFRSFHIIPAEDPATVPENLDYLVKGISRFTSGRLQVNLQLIQARENRLVWAKKFGDSLEHFFQIEEEIVQKIVVSLQQFVDHDLLSRIRQRSRTDLNAYESWLFGMEELKKGSIAADEKARSFFQAAIEKDASFARAYTGMSLTYFNEWSCLLWDQWEENQKNAVDWALKAVELDIWDPMNAFILGKCYLFYKQYKQAEYYLRKAMELNPANPKLLAGIAFCLTYLGVPEEGMAVYQDAVRLDPSKSGFMVTGALVHFENGLYEAAIELGERSGGAAGWIDFPATMAAAYFLVGNQEKMWSCWKQYVEYFHQKIRPGQKIDEQLALEWMISVNPYQRYTHHEPFWEFMKSELGGDFSSEQQPLTPHVSISPPSPSNLFVRDGNIWQLRYQGKAAQLSDLKGLHDIARLIEQPHTSIHCADLMGLTVLESGAPVLDQQAKTMYQKRLLDIQEALAEAEQVHHQEAIERLQREYDDLLQHLSQSIGKSGKSRTASGSLEKARSAATWRIRAAIKKIEAVHPELGAHFKISIKTGLFCTYQPERTISWEL